MPDQARSTSEPASSNLLDELQQSGILSREQVSRFESSLPPQTADLNSLTAHLTAEGLLTDFQARIIAEGRLHELTLGNYNLVDRLGAGGMGEVYRAVHRRMKREVALKVLPPAAVSDHEVVERFHREVEAAARMNHPNIVTAHDADEANGTHFLVMELVDGDDFSRLVRDHGPLSPVLAVECIAQSARGLEYAHAQGVIHRDIKPSNLLLDSQGTVRMLDLGLASLEATAADAGQTPALTHTGTIMGTVDYMAPEQAEDTRAADARSDIYSLGCTLYFLLTGRPPYGGDTLMQRLLAHREQPQPDLPAGIPAALNDVFRRMIARNPADRYHSMTELLTALEKCRIDDPALADTSHGTGATLRELCPQRADDATAPAPTVTIETLNHSSHLEDTLRQPGGSGSPPRKRKWLLLGIIPPLAAVLLAGLVLKLQTPAGTIVLEIDDPAALGAVVTVDERQQITITQEGEQPIEVAADGKRHKLQVIRGGFETFTREFSVGKGETKSIRVRLELVNKETAQHAETVPAADDQPLSLLERNRRAADAIRRDEGQVLVFRGTEIVRSALYVGDGRISGETLSLLTGVPGLEHLVLMEGMDSGPFGDFQLQQIGELPLIQLDMGACGLTDEHIAHLVDLQNLRSLALSGNADITSRSCAAISRLEQLADLNLANTSVDDDGLARLAPLRSLNGLWLENCPVSGTGIAELSRLPNLTFLHLKGCALDDSSVEALGRLSGLCFLDLRSTGLTMAGLTRLRELLPDCSIMHEDLPIDAGEKQAIRLVLEYGGTIRVFPYNRTINGAERAAAPIQGVDLDNAPREVWQAVARCCSVQSIQCINQQDSDGCLTLIRQIPGLRHLTITSPVDALNAEGFQHLRELRRLYQLQLNDVTFPAAGQWDFEFDFPQLGQLALNVRSIDDTGLQRLVRNAPQLRHLYIAGCRGITNECLPMLTELPRLRYLAAAYTALDDTAVPVLARIQQLRYLDVGRTQLTADGVARLREALPECVVVWNDGLYKASPPPAAAPASEEPSAAEAAP